MSAGTTQDIVVRDANGAYTTNRVRGNSGSSTSSAHAAAERLAVKLFGMALQRVELIDQAERVWRFRAIAGPAAQP